MNVGAHGKKFAGGTYHGVEFAVPALEGRFVFPVNAFARAVGGGGGIGHDALFARNSADLLVGEVAHDVADGLSVEQGVGISEDDDGAGDGRQCALHGGDLASAFGLMHQIHSMSIGYQSGRGIVGAIGDKEEA